VAVRLEGDALAAFYLADVEVLSSAAVDAGGYDVGRIPVGPWGVRAVG